ncbi:helix-turn-helix domain-containing protein [Haladaptatus sp. NG-WS-4]
MGSGIYVQIEVTGVNSCPVVSMSENVEVESVVTDRQPTAEGSRVVGEVTVNGPVDASSVPDRADSVFSDAPRSVYRFSNDRGGCPCDRVPDHGCPVRDVHAETGTLVVSFIVPDIETLQTIVADLQSHYDTVRVRRLTQSSTDNQQKLLFVDRSAFTDRQYEVLQTAHDMGYFAHPKDANSTTVAAELGIAVATFSEHLAATQSKLLDQIFFE